MMAVSKLMVLSAVLLASLGVAYDSKKNCAAFCGRGGDKCTGRAKNYKQVVTCEAFNYENRGFANGPDTCSKPNFILTRAGWANFYPVRVCRTEIKCINKARNRNHASTYLKRSMEVLEQRSKNYAIMDEIRFSADRSYVNSINRITSDAYLSELRAHVRARGFETETRFANPVFQKFAAVTAENKKLSVLLSPTAVQTATRQRNTARQKFDKVFRKKWNSIQNAKSNLDSEATRQEVNGYIKDVKNFAKYVRQLQAEAHRLQFFESEFIVLNRDVTEKRKEMDKLRKELAGRELYLTNRRTRVSNIKQALVSKVTAATDAVKSAQERQCATIT